MFSSNIINLSVAIVLHFHGVRGAIAELPRNRYKAHTADSIFILNVSNQTSITTTTRKGKITLTHHQSVAHMPCQEISWIAASQNLTDNIKVFRKFEPNDKKRRPTQPCCKYCKPQQLIKHTTNSFTMAILMDRIKVSR